MSDLVCVKTFPTRLEAEYARSLLESCGIRSTVAADDCAGLRPHLLLGNEGARLLVTADHAEVAAAMLEEGESQPAWST